MKTADQFLESAAKTFRERNAIYGNNFLNIGAIMEGFFPDGLFAQTRDDWNRLHIFILNVVKQSRYANNFIDGGHADSIHDQVVYSAILEQIDGDIANRPLRSGGVDLNDLNAADRAPRNSKEEKLPVVDFIDLKLIRRKDLTEVLNSILEMQLANDNEDRKEMRNFVVHRIKSEFGINP